MPVCVLPPTVGRLTACPESWAKISTPVPRARKVANSATDNFIGETEYNDNAIKSTDFDVRRALAALKPDSTRLHRVIRRLFAWGSFASTFELNRDVTDLEIVLKIVADSGQQFVIDVSIRLHQIDCQRSFGGAHR